MVHFLQEGGPYFETVCAEARYLRLSSHQFSSLAIHESLKLVLSRLENAVSFLLQRHFILVAARDSRYQYIHFLLSSSIFGSPRNI